MGTIRFPWQMMKNVQRIHRLLYAAGLGPLVGKIILLLTTTGRKSGKRRVTPLQYEEMDGAYVVAAARGQKADWFRNILANPQVEVQVRALRFNATAEPVTDPARIADFLQLRLERHPRMVGAMMKMHNLPRKPSRAQLEQLAASLAMVVLKPGTENR